MPTLFAEGGPAALDVGIWVGVFAALVVTLDHALGALQKGRALLDRPRPDERPVTAGEAADSEKAVRARLHKLGDEVNTVKLAQATVPQQVRAIVDAALEPVLAELRQLSRAVARLPQPEDPRQ